MEVNGKKIVLTMEVWKPELIEWHDTDTDMPVSNLLVMKSGAGWYVGELCIDPDCGGEWAVPYARCSTYFPTPELANECLREASAA